MTFPACEVSFDNVPVPVENVIGEVGGGFKVNSILSSVCNVGHGEITLYVCKVISFFFFAILGRLP